MLVLLEEEFCFGFFGAFKLIGLGLFSGVVNLIFYLLN